MISDVSKGPLTFLLIVIIVVAAFGFVGQRAAAAEKEVVVKGSVVNIRSGPGTNHPVISQVKRDDRLSVLDKEGDWYKVRFAAGGTGWIAGWLVTAGAAPVPREGGEEAIVRGDLVNVRSGPGTNHAVVGRFKQGARLEILNKEGDWYAVRLPDGKKAWIAGWLVTVRKLPVPRNEPGGGGKAAGAHLVVKGEGVNIRSGPGTDHHILTQVSRGARLAVLDRRADWYKIQLPGGKTGWIVGWYVDEEPASLPAPPESPPDPPPLIPAPGSTENVSKEEQAGVGGPAPDQEQAGSARGAPLPGERKNPPGEDDQKGAAATEVVVSKENNHTLVKITGAPEVAYHIFRLREPERLVVDITGARPGKLPASLDINSEAVSQLRVGWFGRDPDVTRLVFDLKGRAAYKVKPAGEPKDIVLDIFIPGIKDALQGKTIVLDPGHGGADPGAIGGTGLKEKEINLDLARRTASLLRSYGARVVLTRSGDDDIDLYTRARKANSTEAELFLSIHVNANSSPFLKGTSTYYMRSEANGTERLQKSRLLALRLQDCLVDTLGLQDKGVRRADFVVLRETTMPAVLIEAAFISNPAEEKLLATEQFRENVARAIVEGVGEYFLSLMVSE